MNKSEKAATSFCYTANRLRAKKADEGPEDVLREGPEQSR